MGCGKTDQMPAYPGWWYLNFNAFRGRIMSLLSSPSVRWEGEWFTQTAAPVSPNSSQFLYANIEHQQSLCHAPAALPSHFISFWGGCKPGPSFIPLLLAPALKATVCWHSYVPRYGLASATRYKNSQCLFIFFFSLRLPGACFFFFVFIFL